MKVTPIAGRIKTMAFVKEAKKHPEIFLTAQVPANRAARRMAKKNTTRTEKKS